MNNSPREESIGAQMSIALQLMKRKNHQAISAVGHEITMEQLVVLEVLNIHGDMNMTELSHAVWKQNANITRIVDKLEKKKFVLRKAVKGDRRANLLSVTDLGRKVFNDVIPIVTEAYGEAVSCISKEEEAITLASLKKIIKCLSRS